MTDNHKYFSERVADHLDALDARVYRLTQDMENEDEIISAMAQGMSTRDIALYHAKLMTLGFIDHSQPYQKDDSTGENYNRTLYENFKLCRNHLR